MTERDPRRVALFVDTIERHYRDALRSDPRYHIAAEHPERAVRQIRHCAERLMLAFDDFARRACRELEIESNASAVASFFAGDCSGCGTNVASCGPALFAQQRKCCPDCTHTEELYL